MSQFISTDTFFASKGAKIEYFDANGVMAFETPLPLGRVEAAGYVVPDYEGRVSGAVVVGKPSGYGICESPVKHDSGANPDWQPTSAEWQERKLQMMIDQRIAESVQRFTPETFQVVEPVSAPLTEPAPAADVVAEVS